MRHYTRALFLLAALLVTFSSLHATAMATSSHGDVSFIPGDPDHIYCTIHCSDGSTGTGVVSTVQDCENACNTICRTSSCTVRVAPISDQSSSGL
jgi:hypothetical protein